MSRVETPKSGCLPLARSLAIFAGSLTDLIRYRNTDDVTGDAVLTQRSIRQIRALDLDIKGTKKMLMDWMFRYEELKSPLAMQVVAQELLSYGFYSEGLMYHRKAASIRPATMRQAYDPIMVHKDVENNFIEALGATTDKAQLLQGSMPEMSKEMKHALFAVLANIQGYSTNDEVIKRKMREIADKANKMLGKN